MEGNDSLACLMISKYLHIRTFIKKKLCLNCENKFKKMLQTMVARTKTYLKEALECDAILIATALNPSFLLSIFKMLFPTKYNYAQGWLTNLFNTRKAIVVGTESSRDPT
jgi:hypothetical protein